MKVKSTVLVRSINQSGQSILKEISGQELKIIFLKNKKLPKEERRYFMVSRIREGDVLDKMYIEIPYEEYKAWNSGQTVRRVKNQYRSLYKHISLEQTAEDGGEQAEEWLLAAQDSVETVIETDMMNENLLKALALWQPWAVDLYYAYISGRKYQCNRELAEKYHVTERTIRNYKERFEKFVKLFLEKS